MKNLPTVCIVGRPNVGKSSLFNRILGRRAAVVSDREGVTRDRHYQQAVWREKEFTLVDTGGFLLDDTVDQLAESVRQQIFAALDGADLILFMVDVRVGPQGLDQQFARMVHKLDKPIVLVANKAEKPEDRQEMWAFMGLGLGEPRMVSALSGWAMPSLLDEIISLLPAKKKFAGQVQNVIKFAILGRPNAGKSTLLNKMTGYERAVVSNEPGTTRDSIEETFKWEGQLFSVADTAGLRRKARVSDEVEVYSNMRSLEAIRRADVCVLVIDSLRGFEIQDFRIMEQIRNADRGLVIALNKWDALPEKDHKSFGNMVKELQEKETMLNWVPIIAISALQGQRVPRILQEIKRVYANSYRVLGRDRVIEVFERVVNARPHPNRQQKVVRMTRACQILVNPPVVAIECTQPKLVDESYKRHILKAFYEEFDLHGAALKLNFTRDLDLRKDEELEQYNTHISHSVPDRIDSHGSVGVESVEED